MRRRTTISAYRMTLRWQYLVLLIFIPICVMVNTYFMVQQTSIFDDIHKEIDDGISQVSLTEDISRMTTTNDDSTASSINFVSSSGYGTITDPRWANSNFPRPLQICNITKLKFDESKLYQISNPIALYHRDASINVAYGPLLTKCGTTTVKEMLSYISNSTLYYANFPREIPTKKIRKNIYFSFLRHPLDRILAGHHQVERLLREHPMQFSVFHQKFHLTWWNTSCIEDSGYSDASENPFICTGTKPASDFQARFGRLNSFLDDQIRVGFFDQHTTPMVSLIATNDIFRRNASVYYFNLDDIARFSHALSSMYNRPVYDAKGKQRMSRTTGSKVHHYKWIVTWDEILKEAKTESLAQEVLRKLCTLYRQDVECFPFQVQECDPYF
jgi:hypothetical protein